MFGILFGRLRRSLGPAGGEPAPRPARRRSTFRPRLEQLETRATPAAIRNLPGFTANTLPANDDGSTGAVNVGFTLNFFGQQDNQVFVNNNGNITFDVPLAQFTPSDLNSNNGGIPIIAPFFADVDTTGPGSGLVTYGNDTLCDRPVFGVNWIDVGYFFSAVDRLNSFQLILIDRSDIAPGDFDIEFNYDQIQWETGDASGGTGGLGGESARVGYSNGTGQPGTFFELPGSGINGAFLDGGPDSLVANSQLATTPGRYHFLVRSGEVTMDIDTQPMNQEVTDGTRVLFPLRYISDVGAFQQRGNLSVLNVATPSAGPPNIGATNLCLDIVSTSVPTNPVVVGDAILGPITVVFTDLPASVPIDSLSPSAPPVPLQLLNASGVTASGDPFITVQVPLLSRDVPVLRVPLLLQNQGLNAPSTFFDPDGFTVRVFAGAFDPSLA
jgi:hypothetical protein